MIEAKYIEVEDECLGPAKKNGQWEMYLFVKHITEYKVRKRGSKTEFVKFQRKSKSIVSLSAKTKKEILKKLEDFCNRKDVRLSWLI